MIYIFLMQQKKHATNGPILSKTGLTYARFFDSGTESNSSQWQEACFPIGRGRSGGGRGGSRQEMEG